MTPPQKAQSPGGAGQCANQTSNTRIIGEQAEHGKRVATLIAQLALAGHAVHRLEGGSFLVCHWGLVRSCPDLAALEDFAKRMEVA